MENTFIYGLKEIGKEPIRYVGKSDNPKTRKQEHIREAKKGVKTHKCYWINKVIKSGGKIEVIILEKVNPHNWEEKEIYWINKLKKTLTNTCSGGFGGTSRSKFKLTYNEFKVFIQREYPFIKSRNQYITFFSGVEKPENIPNDPYQQYNKRGWVSWGDFLGTNIISGVKISSEYLSYGECKEWVKNNLKHIKTQEEWEKAVKEGLIPKFIPNRPYRYFKNKLGCFSFVDFLSRDKRYHKPSIIYLNYYEAKEWIKKNMKINSVSEWKNKNNPIITNIPTDAMTYYKKNNTWGSWVDFLNTSSKSPI